MAALIIGAALVLAGAMVIGLAWNDQLPQAWQVISQ